jgi:hypothetical protein
VIGPEQHWADATSRTGRRRDDRRTGPIGEQRRRVAIGEIEELGQEVRADHQGMLGAP